MCLRNSSSPIQCVFAMRLRRPVRVLERARAYSSVLERTRAYSSVLERTRAYSSVLESTRAYSSVLVRTRAYSSVLERTRAYSSVLERARAYSSVLERTRVYSSVLERTRGVAYHTNISKSEAWPPYNKWKVTSMYLHAARQPRTQDNLISSKLEKTRETQLFFVTWWFSFREVVFHHEETQ